MNLTIDRIKWLRGSASMLMKRDGCGCVIGHYLVAQGVPKEVLYDHYGFDAYLQPFDIKMVALGEFESDANGINVSFRPTSECDQIVGVNDGDPRVVHNRTVAPVTNDKQREAVLIRLMKKIDCKLRFV
jgi:hypothetical protein